MRRAILFVLGIFKYALYAVAGVIALYALAVVGGFAYILIGEALIPGFNTADYLSKDQRCEVYPTPKGCPGNR
jgi:hypothetical protein